MKNNFLSSSDYDVLKKLNDENMSIESLIDNHINNLRNENNTSNLKGGNEKEFEKKNQIDNSEKLYEDNLFKEALKNYQGTDSEKSLLNKYINYFFSKRNEDEEGLYLISTNINSIIDMIKDGFFDNTDDVLYPGKYKNEEERIKKENQIKEKKKQREEKKKQEEKKTYYERFNEFVDIDYEDVLKNIIGIRKDISNTILQPEKVFSEQSTFENILEESRKYQYNSRNINLKSIYQMVKVLFQKKKSLYQWLRVASLCETLYFYLNNGKTREIFFESVEKLDINVLLEIEEFWKTDFIFRGNKEKNDFKNQLNFYK